MRKLLFTLFLIPALTSQAQGIRELYQEGLKAYEEKNFQLFKEKMLSIDSMRPNYPAVVYNLAGSYALTGELDKSINTLNKYILMDASLDFSKDSDFEALQNLESFSQIQEKQKELNKEIFIESAFEWSVQSSHPESITYSKKHKSFYLGSVRDGNIWKIEEGEEPKVWIKSESNSWCVMGLEVSSDSKYLWACTAAMENFSEYAQEDQGYSSVLKIDIKTGKRVANYTLTDGHIFGDIIMDAKDNVYVSDGTANILYKVNEKSNSLDVFSDLSGTVFNLQGLTFNKDQTAIYVSDYIDGIYKIDLATKKISKLKVESSEVLLKGIDGLYFKNNSLVGLHNGNTPNRVVRYPLNGSGDTVIGKEIISQAGLLGEPTQGVFVNGEFLYIVNSPWASYDKYGDFNTTSEKLIIGKYK